MKISEEFNEEVLALIKQVVKKREFNYHDLSKRLGLSYSAVYKMLHGRALTVHRLMDLSITLDYNLFAGLAANLELSEPQVVDTKGQREQELEQRIHDLEIENQTLLKVLGKVK